MFYKTKLFGEVWKYLIAYFVWYNLLSFKMLNNEELSNFMLTLSWMMSKDLWKISGWLNIFLLNKVTKPYGLLSSVLLQRNQVRLESDWVEIFDLLLQLTNKKMLGKKIKWFLCGQSWLESRNLFEVGKNF